MDRVGAGLGHHIHHSGNRMASFRSVVVGDDVEFLDALHGEILDQSTDYEVLVVAAIYRGVNLTAIAAINANISYTRFGRIESFGLAHARNQSFQPGEVAVQNRKGSYLCRGNRTHDRGGGSLNQRRLPRNFHQLGSPAGLQGLVHGHHLADQELDSLLLQSREARGLHCHDVATGRKESDVVIAGGAGNCLTRKASRGIGNCDLRFGNDCAGRVHNGPVDGCGRELRRKVAGQQKYRKR